MHDQPEVGQIEPSRRDVGRDADTRAAVAEGGQRARSIVLRELTRQRDDRKPALLQVAAEVRDPFARGAKDQRAARFEEPEHVDDRVIALVRNDEHCPVGDVAVGLMLAGGRDSLRVFLVALRELRDRLGDGRREEERSSRLRRPVQELLEVLAEAHVEHLVRLVEDDGA